MQKNPLLRHSKVLFVVALAHFAFVMLGFLLAGFHGAPSLWPATGLAFGLGFSLGRRAVAGVFIGAFMGNLVFGMPVSLSLIFGTGAALEAAVGAFLIRLMLRRTNEYIFHQESVGVLLASIVAPLLPALVGVSAFAAQGTLAWSDFFTNAGTWWASDFLGGMIWAPLILLGCRLWHRGPAALTKLWRVDLWRGALAWIFLVPLCLFVLGTHAGRPLMFLLLPALLATAWWSGEFGVKVAAALISLFAIMSSQQGLGPIVWTNSHEHLRSLQLFIMTLAFTSMALGIFTRMRLTVGVTAILLAGWFLAGTIFHSFYRIREDQDQAHHLDLIVDREASLRSNLRALENNLRNAAGLFAVQKEVSSSQWMDYVDNLGVLRDGAPIDGFGVAFHVPRDRVPAFERKQRSSGLADFRVHDFPGSHRPASVGFPGEDDARVVTLVGGRNTPKHILGLNFSSEERRKTAADVARDTGRVTVSRSIPIYGSGEPRPGFMILAPLYKPGLPHETVEDRRKNIFAWIYSPVVFQKLLAPIATFDDTELDFFMFDSDRIAPENMIFGTAEFPSRSIAEIDDGKSFLRTFDFGQHSYKILWTRGPDFQTSQDDTLAWIGTLGAMLTLATALMYLYMQTFKQRAEALVEQKTLELSARERLWRTLTEAAPVGIFQTDAQGSYTYVNPKWCELTKLGPHQAFGDGWLNAIHPDDYKSVRDRWEACVVDGRPFAMEYRFLHPHGERWVSAIATRILSENQRTTGFVGIELDITERRTQERLVERERVKAMESSKMASLGEMAGGIAHEINNPLAIIVARAHQVKTLSAQAGTAGKVAEYAEKIEATANRIAKIIRGLRAFSRNSENDPMIPAAVDTVIEDSLELCRERFRTHGIDLSVIGEGQAEILCRPSQISQVLLNLLNNSYDAVVDTTRPWVRIEIEQKNRFIEIAVVNSGRGIPREVALKMMEPFFTTKEIGKGTGLGLSISRGIVEDHAGRLWLDQDYHHTRFVMRLPLAAADEQGVA